VALSALLVAALAAAGVAVTQQQEALRQQRIADSREVAAKADALRTTDPATSALLSVEAFRIAPTEEARSSLLSARPPFYTALPTSRPGAVNGVAISSSGLLVAAAEQAGAIELLDLSPDAKPIPLRDVGSSTPVYGVALSPDGSMVAGAREDGSVQLWDTGSHRRVAAFACGPGAADGVAFSPDGQLVAGACSDGTVRLWDVRSHLLTATLSGPDVPGPIDEVAFMPDGRVVAGADSNGTVVLWDPRTHRQVAALSRPDQESPVRTVAFSSDGGTLAAGSDDGSVALWDTSSQTVRRIVNGSGGGVRAAAFGQGGTALAVSSEQGAVRLWDLTSETSSTVLAGPTAEVRGLAFGPDDTLVAANANSTIGMWTLTLGHRNEAAIGTAAYASAGHVLATTGADHSIRLWLRGSTWRASAPTVPGVPGAGFAMSLSPDGQRIAAPAAGGAIALWDVASPERASVIRGPPEGVNAVAFSPDSRFLAAAEDSATTGTGTVALWMRDGDRWGVARHEVPPSLFGAVRAIAFSPDGGTIASGSEDGPILLSKVPSGSPRGALTGNLNNVEAVAFSPNGRTLASGGADGSVRLWDVSSRRLLATLAGHTEPVVSVAFSPDGSTLASSGEDSTIRLWTVPTRTPMATLNGTAVTTVVFTDGRTLAGADPAGRPLSWSTDANRALADICLGYPALTPSQWQLYVPPDQTFQPVCP
jgi:WD40 repeat protein